MKCPNCGAENPIHQSYCASCGKKINIAFEAIAQSVHAEAEVGKTAAVVRALLAATVLTILVGVGVWLVRARFVTEIRIESALVPAAPPPAIPVAPAEMPVLPPVPGSPDDLLIALPDSSDVSARRFGHRFDPVRKQVHAARGGDGKVLQSVKRGLTALVSHQDRKSGCWRVKGSWEGGRLAWGDTGVTALAVLALLGDGHVWTDPKDTLGRSAGHGVRFLVASQGKSGRIGPGSGNYMYNHGMGTAALAEAYGMSGLAPLREPVEKAVAYLVSAQRRSGGWDYKKGPGTRADVSVTAWQIAALRSAKLAGVDVPEEACVKARKFLASLTSPATGESGYEKRPDPSEKIPHPTLGPTAMSLACRVALGEDPSSPVIARQAAYLLRNLPEWEKEWRSKPPKREMHLFYYWYHGSAGMRGVGGEEWRTWYGATAAALMEGQDRDGSWRHIGHWGADGGRVYSTAMALLALESTYRYP